MTPSTPGQTLWRSVPDCRHLWKWTLACGLLAVILGILVLAWPGISILVAATLFAAYLPVSTLSPRFQHRHDTVADKQTKLDLPAALRGADLVVWHGISVTYSSCGQAASAGSALS